MTRSRAANRLAVLAFFTAACGGEKEPTSVGPDVVAPVLSGITVTAPNDTQLVISGTATDEQGVALVQYRLWSPIAEVSGFATIVPGKDAAFSITIPEPDPTPTTYHLQLKATDLAWNWGDYGQLVKFGPARSRLDIIGDPLDGATLHQRGMVLALIAMPRASTTGPVTIDGLSITIDDVNVTPSPLRSDWRTGGHLDLGAVAEGTHRVRLRATDNESTQIDTTFVVTVRIDPALYDVTYLGTLGGAESRAYDINARGDIVGEARNVAGVTRPVAWINGQIRELPGSSAPARAINNRGEAVGVGRYWNLDAQTDSALGVGDVTDISDRGTITYSAPTRIFFANGVGNYERPNCNSGSFVSDINASDIGAGSLGCDPLDGSQPVLWTPTPSSIGGCLYPGTIGSRRFTRCGAPFINDAGQVIVVQESKYTTFREPAGEVLDLRGVLLDAFFTGLNARGEGVAFSTTEARAYVWSRAGGLRRLTLTNTAWQIDGTAQLDDRGRVLAHGVNAVTGERGALLLTPR